MNGIPRVRNIGDSLSRHPPGELLSGLADGELDDPEAEVVERHIRSCADCAASLSAVRRVRAALRALPPIVLPDTYEDDLIAEVGARVVSWRRPGAGKRSGSRRAVGLFSGVGAAATVGAVAVVAAFAVIAVRPHDTPATPRVGRIIATLAGVKSGGASEQLGTNQVRWPPASSPPGGRLDAPYAAPASLISTYQRVGLSRSPDGVIVVYDDGSYALSVLEQPGSLRRRALPAGGSALMVGTHPGLMWSGPQNRVVMWQDGAAIYTVAGNGPEADVLAAASSLPAAPSISWSQRMRHACRRLVTDLADR